MDRAVWEALLRGAVLQGRALGPNEGHDHPIKVKQHPFRLVVTRTPLHCPACRTALTPDEADVLSNTDTVVCGGCGYPMGVRKPPRWLGRKALPGVTHLLGEDRGVEGDGDGGEARGFPCPGCGAPLPFDGQERALECPYCHAHAWIPDSFIYGSSAPVVRRWFLTGPPVAQDAGADLGVPPLYCVADMTVDREENLYVVCLEPGAGVDEQYMVWSADGDFQPRWIRHCVLDAPGLLDNNARLAVTGDGRLLISRRDVEPLHVLSSVDGSDLGDLHVVARDLPAGERLGRWRDLAMDTDGTLLTIRGDRIRRFGPDGHEVDLWDSGPIPTAVIGEERPARVDDEALGDREWNRVAVGWDGLTYLKGSSRVYGYARDGHLVRRFEVETPPEVRPAVDAAGTLFELENFTRGFLRRWPAEGGQAEVLAEGERDGYPTDDDNRVAVSPGGSVWLQGSSRLHALAPDGTQRFARDQEAGQRCLHAFHQRQRAQELAAAGLSLDEPEESSGEFTLRPLGGGPSGADPRSAQSQGPGDDAPGRSPAPTWAIAAVILAVVFGLALLYVVAFRS